MKPNVFYFLKAVKSLNPIGKTLIKTLAAKFSLQPDELALYIDIAIKKGWGYEN